MTGADDEREFGKLIHVGFAHLARLAAIGTTAALITCAVGIAVSAEWVTRAVYAAVALGVATVLLGMVSGRFDPDTNQTAGGDR
ncbi:hypothetical protein ACH4T9_12835 [Micromonospora sp. NPDC020750]|uniref:hypothetical protein n=1 Tax=unclassified Micromonospora TaxID=2617518 RepID=UPI0037A23E50